MSKHDLLAASGLTAFGAVVLASIAAALAGPHHQLAIGTEDGQAV